MQVDRNKRAKRAYTRRIAVLMTTYVVLIAVAMPVVNVAESQPVRYAAALVPMVPLAFLPAAMIRHLADLDELQRRIQLEALAIGFAGGSFLTFSYGFLQNAGAPAVSWHFVWPVYALCWIAGNTVARRRYGSEK